LFSTPSFAERAAFYGGFRSIASADGDNADGLNTSVRIASADTEQEIQILLESREITHLALPQWDPMTEQLVRWGYGTPTTEPLPRSAFVAALLHWDLPAWIHPMDYVVSVESQYHGLNLTSFAVGEPQSPAVALARLANFFVHRNQFTEAQAVREVLKDYPRDPLALIAMANIDVAVRDAARLNETLTTLVPMLSRRSARNLPADFRVTLATVFTRVNRPELARTEIQKSFEQLTLETLRSWSPGSVIDLLSNSRALNEPWPTAHLREAALELIPPRVRSQFQVLGSSAPD
jgi:hypothetical protein